MYTYIHICILDWMDVYGILPYLPYIWAILVVLWISYLIQQHGPSSHKLSPKQLDDFILFPHIAYAPRMNI